MMRHVSHWAAARVMGPRHHTGPSGGFGTVPQHHPNSLDTGQATPAAARIELAAPQPPSIALPPTAARVLTQPNPRPPHISTHNPHDTNSATLCQAEGSALAALFSPRWFGAAGGQQAPLPRDREGLPFLDYDPTCFRLLLGYLRCVPCQRTSD